MINWLCYCTGISISYDRLLDITRDLSKRVLNQCDRDGVFILCNLKKNIFTIIAKYNIDHNARSTAATKHDHGTSFSVFHFPSVAFPGDIISYPDELCTRLNQVIQKNLVAFSRHTQKFEYFFHHLLHLHFQQHQPQSYLILTVLFTSK